MPRHKPDMRFAGRVIKDEIDRLGGPVQFVEDHPNSPARATLYRIFAGGLAFNNKSVRKLEVTFGWPRGTVELLARRDFQALLDVGIDPDFVRYARETG